jgi:4-hydroxy-tetrahydrodipicolinate reductase
MINVCIAGATGLAGRAIVDGVIKAGDLALRSAVARSAAGLDLGTALGRETFGVAVYASVAEALEGVDVLIDYTTHLAVRANAMAAIERGVAVVIGASGLTLADYAEIDAAARRHAIGVISAGNFSVTAAMALAAAALAARHLPSAEIIDYAGAMKPDVPSGTSREMAERLALVRPQVVGRTLAETDGPREARGVEVAGMQVHSVRLPSFSVSTEVIFALPDERLTIRHDGGLSMQPYVSGTLLAVRRVVGRVGLTRGLDTLLLEA